MGNLNQRVFEVIFGFAHRNPLLDAFGVFLAEYLPYLMVLGAVVLMFSQRGTRQRILFACEAALAVILARGIVTEVIRFFYHHPRPFTALQISALISESGYSFPSGHATAYFALATIVFFMNRKWGWWYLGLALLNGVARVFVGVHWPLDIVGGAAIGVLSGVFIRYLLVPFRRAIFAEKRSPDETA